MLEINSPMVGLLKALEDDVAAAVWDDIDMAVLSEWLPHWRTMGTITDMQRRLTPE